MKLDRMLAITLELMAKKRVRASELAARFEVSTRTIYREMELINQAGIPIVSYTGADGGYEIMDGFFLTKQHFTIQDFSAIYQLLHSLEGAVGDKFTLLREKLNSLHPKISDDSYSNEILFDLTTQPKERQIVHTVYRAIQSKQLISFAYRSAAGSVSERTVEPTRLLWERGVWYLEAYCLSAEAPRSFRVSRMAELQALKEKFETRELKTINEEPLGIVAHLRFEHCAEPRVSEQFGNQCRHTNDCIEVETVFYHMDYAVSVLLSYGSKVTVLSPPELREALVSEIKRALMLYENPT